MDADLDLFGLTFEIKSIDQKKRIIEGYASTPHLDDGDDIVEPGAAKFTEAKQVIPFVGHKHNELPVGYPLEIKYDEQGRLFTSTKIHNTHAGDDLLAVARERADAGMPLGISIGYPPSSVVAKYERKSGGRMVRRISSLDLVEYSFTPIPMNEHSVVTAVKSKTRPTSKKKPEQLEKKASEMSAEERQAEIREAIANRMTPPATMPAYCYVVATFDAYVICSDGDDYWRVDYTIGADGEVTLGAQVEVEQTWSPKTSATADTESGTKIAKVIVHDDAAVELEKKAGRVLSSGNLARLQSIHDSAHGIAEAAGLDLHGDAASDADTPPAKTPAAKTAKGTKTTDLAIRSALLDLDHIEAATQTARRDH